MKTTGMCLIADSGSTKTDWVLTANGQVVDRQQTDGINPVHQNGNEIERTVRSLAFKVQSSELSVFFYGSGCTPERSGVVAEVLRRVYDGADVEVQSDLLGAARALCGRHEGIACILGTGANSCLYDGRHVTANTPALGYVLGDEGSGAVLGRNFLNAIFKDARYSALREAYLEEQQMTMADIIDRVYRQPLPNRFLATTSLFIHRHLDHEPLCRLVVDNFRLFLQRNLAPYGRRDLAVGAVGSMAYHYRPQLQEAAEAEGYRLGCVVQSPIDGLVAYHAE